MSQPDTSTLAGRIAVMQAALDGKQIQFRDRDGFTKSWTTATFEGLEFFPDWHHRDYRIKPQEPLRCWPRYNPRTKRFGDLVDRQFNEGVTEDAWRSVPMIELTPEVAEALVAAGIIGGDA